MGYAFCCVPPARLYIIGNSHHAVSMPLLQSHNTKLAAQVFCTVVNLCGAGTVDRILLSQYVARGCS